MLNLKVLLVKKKLLKYIDYQRITRKPTKYILQCKEFEGTFVRQTSSQ